LIARTRKKKVPDEIQQKPEDSYLNVLTGIHFPYTMSGTNEVDEIMIKHFLETLAEVALSIASRKEENQ
jgi:hypothetical protein